MVSKCIGPTIRRERCGCSGFVDRPSAVVNSTKTSSLVICEQSTFQHFQIARRFQDPSLKLAEPFACQVDLGIDANAKIIHHGEKLVVDNSVGRTIENGA
jgi:hypothetical protein